MCVRVGSSSASSISRRHHYPIQYFGEKTRSPPPKSQSMMSSRIVSESISEIGLPSSSRVGRSLSQSRMFVLRNDRDSVHFSIFRSILSPSRMLRRPTLSRPIREIQRAGSVSSSWTLVHMWPSSMWRISSPSSEIYPGKSFRSSDSSSLWYRYLPYLLWYHFSHGCGKWSRWRLDSIRSSVRARVISAPPSQELVWHSSWYPISSRSSSEAYSPTSSSREDHFSTFRSLTSSWWQGLWGWCIWV